MSHIWDIIVLELFVDENKRLKYVVRTTNDLGPRFYTNHRDITIYDDKV